MSKKVTRSTNPLLAAVLAYLVPGAGHFYLGRRVRGIIIFLVIGGTFWTGMAIGGPLTMDYYNDRIWFFAQMCNGVHGLYGWQRQKNVYESVFEKLAQSEQITENRAIMKYFHDKLGTEPNKSAIAYGYMQGLLDSPPEGAPLIAGEVEKELQSQGVALALMPTLNVARPYAGIAGMLNLLCIMDAVILAFMGVYGEPPPHPPRTKEDAA